MAAKEDLKLDNKYEHAFQTRKTHLALLLALDLNLVQNFIYRQQIPPECRIVSFRGRIPHIDPIPICNPQTNIHSWSIKQCVYRVQKRILDCSSSFPILFDKEPVINRLSGLWPLGIILSLCSIFTQDH